MKHPRLIRFKPRRRATRDTSKLPALRALSLATCNSSLAPCNLSLATCNSSLEPCALQLETVPYDEHLLERSCTQWQFGDWQSLAKISRQILQHHPDRGKLALFTAAGLLQTDEHERAKEFVRLALNWGVTKKQVCQILVAGVHNSLGRVAALGGQEERAYQHFERAVAIGTPGSDSRAFSRVRLLDQLGCLQQSTVKEYWDSSSNNKTQRLFQFVEDCCPLDDLDLNPIKKAWELGLWEELMVFDNAELSFRPNRADIVLYAACGYQQLDDMEGLQRCTQLAKKWGCPQGKLKSYLAAGMHNTLALSNILTGLYKSAAKNFKAALTIDFDMPKPKLKTIEERIRIQLKTLKNINIEQVQEAILKNL